MDWQIRPTLIDEWDQSIDTIMAIDENGTTDLRGIKKKIRSNFFQVLANKEDTIIPQDRWFTITGVILKREDFPSFKDKINSIKFSQWDNGKYKYKNGLRRVVFHSREIRKREGPFNPKLIEYGRLMTNISNLVQETDFKIFSASIDKLEHVLRYSNPFPVYTQSLEFIIERYTRYLTREKKNGILLLESRGKEEDAVVLQHVISILKNGNRFWEPSQFQCIKGVYFNPKWSFKQDHQTSFVLLELADIVSYPIFKYVSTGTQDLAFDTLKNKIYNYPHYNGYGLKTFPK